MRLCFDQRPLPDGVLSMVVDDGETIVHVFSECAPWPVVSAAMSQSAEAYAERHWQRCPARSSAA